MKVSLITNTPEPQRLIETCARISYQSKNDPYAPEVNSKFIRKLVSMGHESPLEHASATFLIDGVSRACSHQIVRHRLASFSQRSDRYVEFDLSDPKRCPSFTVPKKLQDFPSRPVDELSDEDSPYYQLRKVMSVATTAYRKLIEAGIPKEDARLVMPQSVQTSLYMTANFREWRHFLKLRLDRHAQWEIQRVAQMVLFTLHNIAPDCFHDIACDFLGMGHDLLFADVERRIIERIEGTNDTSGASR